MIENMTRHAMHNRLAATGNHNPMRNQNLYTLHDCSFKTSNPVCHGHNHNLTIRSRPALVLPYTVQSDVGFAACTDERQMSDPRCRKAEARDKSRLCPERDPVGRHVSGIRINPTPTRVPEADGSCSSPLFGRRRNSL